MSATASLWRHVDASLVFGIVCLNKTRALERCRIEKRRAFSTRVDFFANGGSIDLSID